jgi:hypothetical protein
MCSFQLLVYLASTVFLGSESRGTREHILLSHVPVFISPRVAQLYLQALG